MTHKLFYAAAAAFSLTLLSPSAKADNFQFGFAGGGVNGAVNITYGTAADSKYPQALEVTGASGTFSDSNLGISGVQITGLVPINHAMPEPGNNAAPNDFSHYVAANTQHGYTSFDNLYWPGGSVQTATSYPPHGGFVDIYGLLLTLKDGDVVNFWSNGFLGGAAPDYGVSVLKNNVSLDSVQGGVTATPEPATWCLLGTGLLGAFLVRRFA